MKIYYLTKKTRIFKNGEKVDYNINTDIDIENARKNFNAAIDSLSVKYNSLYYWLLCITERNPAVSSFFQDYCYICLISKLILNNNNIEVFTDNYAIYTYFKNKSETNLKDKILFYFRKQKEKCIQIISSVKFLFKCFYIFILSRLVPPKKQNFSNDFADITLIQTWVADANFSNHDFIDSYYGDLNNFLAEKKRKCLIWPIFYNVKSYITTIKFIRKKTEKFILTEDYLRIADFFVLIKHFIIKLRIASNISFYINKQNYTEVFKYHCIKERPLYSSLIYCFIKNISKTKLNISKIILNHENMIPEKAVIIAKNEYCPDLEIIGYYHTTKPRNILCLDYAGNKEFSIAPKPDKIIFNSQKYLKFFKDKYQDLNCINGFAFKQGYLENIKFHIGEANKILVLLPGNMGEALLLLDMLNHLKKKLLNFSFYFRFHPMNNFKLKYFCQLDKIEIIDEPITTSYNRVNKVICPYSACLLEAALAGKKVGFIYNPHNILVNPFDDTGIYNYKLISTEKDLFNFLVYNNKINSKPKNIFNTNILYKNVFL